MHPDLLAQLEALGIDASSPPDPRRWTELCDAISQTYERNERQTFLLERTLETFDLSKRDFEKRLSQARTGAQLVFGATSDGIFTLDRQGRVLECNEAAARFARAEAPEQILGAPIFELLALDGVRTERDFLDAVARDAWRDDDATTTHQDPDARRYLSCSFDPIDAGDGAATQWMCSARDLTTQRRFAEQLRALNAAAERARDEAIEASETKSRFLANMSHELRTPLNAIIGYAELLIEDEQERAPSIPSPLLADLTKIHAAARHLLSLINDLLDLSKIEAGRLRLNNERVDLLALLTECFELCAPLADRNANTMTLDVDPSVGFVLGDRMRIKQVLVNLISNACKFTLDGHVTLRAWVEQRAGVDVARVEVRDDGIGMTEETLARIFKPFAQADDSTTREHSGTGLGLTIARRLCRMMGGELSVESAPEQGSIFTLELAATLGGAGLEEFSGAIARGVEDIPLVLLIDDDPKVREIVRRQLASSPVRVVVASDGSEGLSMARALEPDAIVLDVFMPDVDGWTVLARLRADETLRSIPVVMISSQEPDLPRVALGADDFLVKPIDRAQLLDTLERFLGHLEDPGTLLIVEDDDDVREILRRTLSNQGFSLVEAVDGQHGLERLDQIGTPTLILLDLMMPRVDGFEFLRRLRAREDCADVPVVILTAKTLTSEERARLLDNAESVFRKGDQSTEELRDALLSLLDKRRRRADSSDDTTPDDPEVSP